MPDLEESGTPLVLFLYAQICHPYAQMWMALVSGPFRANLLCHCDVWISLGFVRVLSRKCLWKNELYSGSTPAASTNYSSKDFRESPVGLLIYGAFLWYSRKVGVSGSSKALLDIAWV